MTASKSTESDVIGSLFPEISLNNQSFFSISCPCSLFLALGLYVHFCIMHSQTEERMQGEVRIILWHCCQLVFILRFLLFSARKKHSYSPLIVTHSLKHAKQPTIVFFLWRHCYTNCITFNLNYLLTINIYVLKIPFIFNVSNSFYHLSKSGYWGVSWSRLRIKWPVWPTNSQQMYVQTPLYTQLQI